MFREHLVLQSSLHLCGRYIPENYINEKTGFLLEIKEEGGGGCIHGANLPRGLNFQMLNSYRYCHVLSDYIRRVLD
jgi:hypothetical protein